MAENGGFAAIACRYTPGRTMCDEQARPVPATAVTVDPVAVDAEAGQGFVDVPVFATFDGPDGPQWSDRVHVVRVGVPGWPVPGVHVTGRPRRRDDPAGSVTFQVLVDDEVRHDSGVVRPGPAVPVSVDTTGARMLTLRVTDGGDGKNFDHADWVDARLDCQG